MHDKINESEMHIVDTQSGKTTGYYKDNSQFTADEKGPFYYYFTTVIRKKNILLEEVYSFAGLTKSIGEGLVSTEICSKKRDPILRLCIAGHFNLDEVKRALMLCGMPPLCDEESREACLISAINSEMYDLNDVDELLEKEGFEKLSVEIE